MDLTRYAAVLLDLDGTIYHEDHPIPGAVELVRALQARRQPYACITNSTQDASWVLSRLGRMGLGIDPSHVYTAADAAADHVLHVYGRSGRRPRVFNLGTEGIARLLQGKVAWVERIDEPCDAVICGNLVSEHARDDDRKRTALALLRDGAELVGICADRVYPSPRGIEFGVGALAAMLQYASGVPPVFCGKPERLFFDELCGRLGVNPADCVLIGDNLESDIAGGNAVGMATILTLTGVTRREDLNGLEARLRPTAVVETMEELAEG